MATIQKFQEFTNCDLSVFFTNKYEQHYDDVLFSGYVIKKEKLQTIHKDTQYTFADSISMGVEFIYKNGKTIPCPFLIFKYLNESFRATFLKIGEHRYILPDKTELKLDRIGISMLRSICSVWSKDSTSILTLEGKAYSSYYKTWDDGCRCAFNFSSVISEFLNDLQKSGIVSMFDELEFDENHISILTDFD